MNKAFADLAERPPRREQPGRAAAEAFPNPRDSATY